MPIAVTTAPPRSRKEQVLELLHAKRIQEAQVLCERVAKIENNPGAWILLGAIHGMRGNLDEAEACCRRALTLNPGDAVAQCHLGMVQERRERFDEAVASFREALRNNPAYVDALAGLGRTLFRLGRPAEAIVAYHEILTRQPSRADIHLRLGTALAASGQYEQAVTSYRHAIALDPKNPEAHYNLGNALRSLNRREEAVDSYRDAITRDPTLAQAHCNLGLVLSEQGRYEEAVTCYRDALVQAPDDAIAHNNRGRALSLLGHGEDAIAAYRRAIALKPDYAEAYNNLGIALANNPVWLDEAIAAYRHAIALKPDYAEAYNNLAAAVSFHSLAEAGEYYRQAAILKPDFAEARFNLSLIQLLGGDFDAGWDGYEWRWRCEGNRSRAFSQSAWDGTALAGRTILLHPEQGYGDTLQFIRYAPLIKQIGGQVIVECPPPLARLLRTAPGIDQLVEAGSALPAFDVHLPLLSLPRVFRTRLDSIPANAPYLLPPDDFHSALDSALASCQGRQRVGVVWAGRETHRNDTNRSCPLACFVELAERLGLTLFSLQKGPRSLAGIDTPAGFPITDLSAHLDDFYDTALAIMRLDLVITVDTSVAHLAGALGRPVWVLLPFLPDWRWLLDREDSPWYPSMRLFRQATPGDWKGVFQRIADALANTMPQSAFQR